jgi:Na+/H+ antiporter NhaD/arsenite permease-like protein
LIFSGKVHRTIAAWGASIALLVVGKYYGFLTEEAMYSFIDFNVIGLLLGMMTIASMLEISGFFEFIAVKLAKIAKGKPWLLLVILGTGNTVISLFIDNVTSIILFAPVTIMICRKLDISPVPILMSEALLADTGGVGSLVGDPPNIMIASASGFGFNDFPITLGPAVFVAWIITIFYLGWYYRKWRNKPSEKIEELMSMNEWDFVKNKPMMYKTVAALAFTITVYILNDFMFHLEVSTVALVGGAGRRRACTLHQPAGRPARNGKGGMAGTLILCGPLHYGGLNRRAWPFGCSWILDGRSLCRQFDNSYNTFHMGLSHCIGNR